MKKAKENVVGLANRHLGNTATGYSHYDEIDETLLVQIPRSLSRDESGITFVNFYGYDVWHCYEFSVLRNDGFPVNAILKVVYTSSSQYLVESKSLKLYLHSYNFVPMGSTNEAALEKSVERIKQDLERVLHVDVKVGSFMRSKLDSTERHTAIKNDIVEKSLDLDGQGMRTNYGEGTSFDPDAANTLVPLKSTSISTGSSQLFSTSSMRSNCRVTNQPDWATAFIKYQGKKAINPDSLMKYILSMRKENHFHEEACELLYNTIYHDFKPSELSMVCFYTRRGGIDINPVRYIGTNKDICSESFANHKALTRGLFRQ